MRIWKFIKKETVFSGALFLAILSAFLVPPDGQYIQYIDFRTLAILFCLMTIMSGLKKLGMFRYIGEKLLMRVKSTGQLVTILVLLCFFFSMLITNDVALLTFVPFTFTVLGLSGKDAVKQLAVPVVVLQTLAANLGSMLTPMGNPQNLYLYGKAGVSLAEFLRILFPYTALSLVLLLFCCFVQGRGSLGKKKEEAVEEIALQTAFAKQVDMTGKGRLLSAYLILFAMCLFAVGHVLPAGAAFLIVLCSVLVLDAKTIRDVDYFLLLTFVGFFIFIGNMGRIPVFCEFLQNIIAGHEVATSVVASQMISNVPAALLLSGFTENWEALIIGTNLGGLGTLIASMASLISYKAVVRELPEQKGRYFLQFTVANVCFLAILVILYAVMKEACI